MALDEGSGSMRASAEATDQLIDAKRRATAPRLSIGAPPRLSEWLIEHSYAAEADQQREGEANGESLGVKEKNLGQRHEDRNGREHDGGDARWHALFGPEEEAVVDEEDQQGEQE